jgi:UDP-glucose:(heptosyl)LPS alpha-1,3-glucosyltransferase
MHFVPHSFWVKEIRGKKYPSLFDLATIWVERRMLSEPGSCEYMLPVSSLAANKFISEYPQFKGNIQVVYPGISENFKRTKNKNARQKIRCQFGISPSDFLLLFVGMNFKLKGLDQLLSAMVQIHKQTKSNRLKLLVVGKGNRQNYKAITQSLGIENEVIFAGVRHDMPAIYHSADAFALLSKFDTFGMVGTEAMSTGLPVIVSESVGAKDLVRNGENGFIVKHSETNELCLRLISLMKKKPQITASRNDMLLADLNWTNIAAKVVEKYETLCADS